MRRTLAYTSLAVVSVVIVTAFVTAKTYTQLSLAVAAYPIFMFFVYKFFLNAKHAPATVSVQAMPISKTQIYDDDRFEKVEVADIDKRTFLKIIGTAGISFFIFSLLGRRVENMLFGRLTDSGINPMGETPQQSTGTGGSIEGYKISEIDDTSDITYYGFVNKDGAWFIMKENLEANTYRYTRGDSGFSLNWQIRGDLKYDYYFNLF